MRFKVFIHILLILSLLAPLARHTSQTHAQVVIDPEYPTLSSTEEIIDEMIYRMSPLEKVGQLMLVTFEGTDTSNNAKIVQLIKDYHIGGVVLSTANGNFVDTDTADATTTLINTLQDIAYQKSQDLTDLGALKSGMPVYIPLYVGISQNAEDDYSHKILPGLANLPSEMTLGATWSPGLADAVGQAYGAELSSLGFNLLLGPNLDLIDSSEASHGLYTGTKSFGSNPYWAGKMARAFVSGLHIGSENRLTVIATHFPGLGNVDRPPNQEVSTIQRSLEQLMQQELAPFMALASPNSNESGVVDGMMASHIRYQGLQGNIQSSTRPISFDQIAMQQLFDLAPLDSWRETKGLMISDSLGSPAVRRFFDPSGVAFDPPSIARMAFLAGNDMLYLNNFAGYYYEDQADTIQRTISFFAQKYQEDSVFAQLVDESVGRILANKLNLYGEFTRQNVLVEPDWQIDPTINDQLTLDVARNALTLLAPEAEYLNTIFNESPNALDFITIFSDTRSVQVCEGCSRTRILGVDDFENTLIGLYGSAGTRQIADSLVNSYSFAQLTEFLNGNTETTSPYLKNHVDRSRWIIFNIMDLDPNNPSSYALQRVLNEQPTLFRDKMVLVFAYDTPYYLDSTEVSKIGAYYGLFTPSKASLELASRVLMLEARPRSALPFSLSAVGYDLQKQLAPNPNQIINIALLTEQDPAIDENNQNNPIRTSVPDSLQTPMPLFRLGEAVRIQAGPILDLNGNTVPDGTPARFTIRLASDQLITAQPEAGTIDGFATIEYRVEREGIFAVTVSSGAATTSATLILTTQGGLAEIVMPTPTLTPTIEPSMTPEPSFTPEPSPTPTPEPIEEVPVYKHPSGYPNLTDWLLIIMLLITGFGLSFMIGYYWWKGRQWAIRSGVCTVLGGLVAYILLSLGFPGLGDIVREGGTWFVVQMSLVGMLFGWIAALIWWLRIQDRERKLNIPD